MNLSIETLISFLKKHKRAVLLSSPLLIVGIFIIFDFLGNDVIVYDLKETNASAIIDALQQKRLKKDAAAIGVPFLRSEGEGWRAVEKYSNILIRNGQMIRGIEKKELRRLKGLPDEGLVVPGFLTTQGAIGFVHQGRIYQIEGEKK